MKGLNFSNSRSSNRGTPTGKSKLNYGRVLDIILDSDHEGYYEHGEALSLNGVYIRMIGQSSVEDLDRKSVFAYCGNASIKRIPLIGEIVKLETIPAPPLTGEGSQRGSIGTRLVYTDVVNSWNNPEHGANPDTSQKNWQKNLLGKDFKEHGKINPLQAFPGDITIEGRQGQSIRMTGTKHPSNTLVDVDNNGDPLTVISNGQIQTDEGFTSVVEDPNEDAASIWLTSNHSVPLEEANSTRKSYKEAPDQADTYRGAQVLVTSGRLFFNASEDHLLLASKKSIGLTADTVHLDGSTHLSFDAPKIYLGEKAFKDSNSLKEPLLKGKTSVEWLEDLVKVMDDLSQFLLKDLAPAPAAAIPQLKAYGGIIKGKLVPLKARLSKLKSKKVYTE